MKNRMRNYFLNRNLITYSQSKHWLSNLFSLLILIQKLNNELLKVLIYSIKMIEQMLICKLMKDWCQSKAFHGILRNNMLLPKTSNSSISFLSQRPSLPTSQKNMFETLALYLWLILTFQTVDIKTLGPEPSLKSIAYYSIPSNFVYKTWLLDVHGSSSTAKLKLDSTMTPLSISRLQV